MTCAEKQFRRQAFGSRENITKLVVSEPGTFWAIKNRKGLRSLYVFEIASSLSCETAARCDGAYANGALLRMNPA